MHRPTLIVLIATYNREGLLKATREAVRATTVDCEIIVCDQRLLGWHGGDDGRLREDGSPPPVRPPAAEGTAIVYIVGRVETNKDLIMLIWASRDTGIPIVVVGKPYEAKFVELCQKWAEPNVHFLGGLTPHLLESALAAAKVQALPSWHELSGLVSTSPPARRYVTE